jgi:hypothetical protein
MGDWPHPWADRGLDRIGRSPMRRASRVRVRRWPVAGTPPSRRGAPANAPRRLLHETVRVDIRPVAGRILAGGEFLWRGLIFDESGRQGPIGLIR